MTFLPQNSFRLSSLSLLTCLAFSPLAIAADATKPPGENFDLTHWKLTLPVDSSGKTDGKATEHSADELADGFVDPDYFYTGGDGAMVFWCPVNGATTPGSDYPRSELREMLDPSDSDVNWTAKGSHVLDARCRVTEAPSSQKVIVGQIHSASGKARPLIKLQYYKGGVEAQVKTSPAKGKDQKLVFPNVGLNKDIDYQIKLENGLLAITVNGVTKTENILENDPDWGNQTFYFKAGAYCQDNEGPATEGARVTFSSLGVTHSDSSAPTGGSPD